MEESEELKTVKKTIRSLLISVKEGLSVRDLENDYIEFEGTKLPFAKFGFLNAGAFLHALTDVVYFFRDENGMEKMKQVSDQSTIHIERLVAKQKSDPKKKKPNRAPFPLSGPTSQSFNNRGRRFSGRGGRRGYPQPFTYAMGGHAYAVGGQSVRKGLLPNPVQNPKYNQMFPLLPYLSQKKNSSSSHDGTYDFNAARSVMTAAYIRETMQHGSDLNQKRNVQESKSMEAFSSRWQRSDGMEDAVERSSAKAGLVGVWNSNSTLASAVAQVSPTNSNLNQAQPQVQLTVDDSDSDWDDDPVEQKSSNAIGMSMAEDDCIISQGVQDKIKQVLETAPKGLWAKRLPVVYKQMFKQDLPVKEFGLHSVIEFVSQMPHLVRIDRPYPNGDWLLSDQRAPKPDPEDFADNCIISVMGKKGVGGEPAIPLASHLTQQKTMAEKTPWPKDRNLVPFSSKEELKESVRQVLQHYVEGVMLHHFTRVYEEMTGHLLEPQAYGHEDMGSLLLYLTENEVLTMNYDGKEATRLFCTNKSGIRSFDLLKDAYKPHSQQGLPSTLQVVPHGVVGPGRCYPPADMEGLMTGNECEVIVSSVINPSLFWLHKRCDARKLDDLMDMLEAVYSVEAGKLRMPQSMMVHGQVCAALFEDNNWHRGIITGSSDSQVTMYFVDYGNTCSVDPSIICFLKEQFLSLPVQAFQCKMAFLLPLDGSEEFSDEASQLMFSLILNRPLLAVVADIENLVLSVVLMDTSGPKDLIINDELAERGLTKFVAKKEKEEEANAASGNVDQNSKAATPFYSQGRRYVKLLKFSPDIEFHVVYFGGEVLVMSSEISCLFWEEDCLSFMLQQSKHVLEKLILSQPHYPALFDELARHGALYFEDDSVQVLHLYKFQSLPMILDLFGDHSSKAEELKKFVERYMYTFDHNDPYWKGMDEELVLVGTSECSGTENDTDLDPEDVLTKEELQLALHTMQINRKRILRRMTMEPTCVKVVVKDLEEAEQNIQKLQDLLNTLEMSHTTDLRIPVARMKETPCSGHPTATSTLSLQPQGSTLCASEVRSQDPQKRSLTIKTNVVSPMMKPPAQPHSTASAAPPVTCSSLSSSADVAPSLCHTDLLPESLELMEANRRLIEEIQHKDQIISSMLGVGVNGAGMLDLNIAGGLGMHWMNQASGMGLNLPPQNSMLLHHSQPSAADQKKPEGAEEEVSKLSQFVSFTNPKANLQRNDILHRSEYPAQAEDIAHDGTVSLLAEDKQSSQRQADSLAEDNRPPCSEERVVMAQPGPVSAKVGSVVPLTAVSAVRLHPASQQLPSPPVLPTSQPLPSVSVYLSRTPQPSPPVVNLSQPPSEGNRPILQPPPNLIQPLPPSRMSKPAPLLPALSLPCSVGDMYAQPATAGVHPFVQVVPQNVYPAVSQPMNIYQPPSSLYPMPIVQLPSAHAQAGLPMGSRPLMGLLPYRGHDGGAASHDAPGSMWLSGAPTSSGALQQQLNQLHQQQRELYQQVHTSLSTRGLQASSAASPGCVGRELLPGMVPLLHSFQEKCVVQQSDAAGPNAVVLPVSSAGARPSLQ